MHSNPFIAGPMLQNPELFVGREEELRAIISRMRGLQPTSLNIVGEHRIGKSSLLYHFFLTWGERVSEPEKYVVIYLSLNNANSQNEKSFYQAIAQKLLNCACVKKQETLAQLLEKKPLERWDFSQAIEEFKNLDLLPVLCLDDFESLFAHRNDRQKEFDNGFYDNLRALMDDSALMLVIASCKELDFYGKENRFVSSFFNVGHVIKLGELTTDDSIQLTSLSISSREENPALTEQEQKLAQKWGKCHPYLLQLASYYLWEARHLERNFQWAEKSFKEQFDKYQSQLDGNYRNKILWLLITIFFIVLIGIIVFILTMPQFILNILDTIINYLKSVNFISIERLILNILGAIGIVFDTIENLANIIFGLSIMILIILAATRLFPEIKESLLNFIKKLGG